MAAGVVPDGSRIARFAPTLAAVGGVLLTAYLGSWQLDRAAYKQSLQAQAELADRQPPVHMPAEPVTAGTLDYRRVEAEGTFRPEATIFLDNRVHQGQVGYEVLTPLQVGATTYVLVKRGWVKAAAARDALPAVETPGGQVRVEGLALPPSHRYVELSPQTVSGNVWQNLSLERYAQQYGLTLQPVVIQQSNDLPDGLVRAWRRPDTGVDTHRAYALQWLAMSLSIAILYLVLHVRRRSKAPQRAA